MPRRTAVTIPDEVNASVATPIVIVDPAPDAVTALAPEKSIIVTPAPNEEPLDLISTPEITLVKFVPSP